MPSIVQNIWAAAWFIPSASVTIRRLRDAGYKFTWLWRSLIPFYFLFQIWSVFFWLFRPTQQSQTWGLLDSEGSTTGRRWGWVRLDGASVEGRRAGQADGMAAGCVSKETPKGWGLLEGGLVWSSLCPGRGRSKHFDYVTCRVPGWRVVFTEPADMDTPTSIPEEERCKLYPTEPKLLTTWWEMPLQATSQQRLLPVISTAIISEDGVFIEKKCHDQSFKPKNKKKQKTIDNQSIYCQSWAFRTWTKCWPIAWMYGQNIDAIPDRTRQSRSWRCWINWEWSKERRTPWSIFWFIHWCWKWRNMRLERLS